MSANFVWYVYSVEYQLPLPDEKQLVGELNRKRRILEARGRQTNGEVVE